ncbi:peptidase M4 [Anaerobacillus alkalilacustris]|uniref:Peptidase M4 n=1 Tax=Anaerobacillus alkalilacustris TaxID=393763 RepID=A0A1S2LJT8_9BACI|nr:PepSY domain-containing protein [Anaerobacillus alkalilacustris]OIJ12460.1 peptidase M4 [Anaerobacillus alkalilacustris]
MNIKRFLIGLGIGFAVGSVLKDQLTQEFISPEKALRIVKGKVGEQGVVEGSWIHMIPEDFEKRLLNYTVYRGGISCSIEGDLHQFEFIVDAKTGTILELS